MNNNEPITIGTLIPLENEEELFSEVEITSYFNGYPVFS